MVSPWVKIRLPICTPGDREISWSKEGIDPKKCEFWDTLKDRVTFQRCATKLPLHFHRISWPTTGYHLNKYMLKPKVNILQGHHISALFQCQSCCWMNDLPTLLSHSPCCKANFMVIYFKGVVTSFQKSKIETNYSSGSLPLTVYSCMTCSIDAKQ